MCTTQTNLQGIPEQSKKHRWCRGESDALDSERWESGPRIKQVWVIADLAQLHQNVDDTHEVAGRQRLLCPGQPHRRLS